MSVAWWWLSFADPKRPKGQQFLGVAIVQALDADEALSEAAFYGCNPGGEVAFFALAEWVEVPPTMQNRLLSKDEAQAWIDKPVVR